MIKDSSSRKRTTRGWEKRRMRVEQDGGEHEGEQMKGIKSAWLVLSPFHRNMLFCKISDLLETAASVQPAGEVHPHLINLRL